MRVISTFSGIGGIDLAFSWAGFDIVAQVEIDEFCRKVLAKHAAEYWPNAKQYEDIHHVEKHNLPETDVLVGGFPCQDLSHAGKRAGLDAGTRSGLWWELARLISELRPRVVLLENVAGIYTLGGTNVLGSLAEMGYDAIWLSLRAADVGAPHSRERWFCLAYRIDNRWKRGTGNNGKRRIHSAQKRKHSEIYKKQHQRKRGTCKSRATLAYLQSHRAKRKTRNIHRSQRAHRQSVATRIIYSRSDVGNPTSKQHGKRNRPIRKQITPARHRTVLSTRSGRNSAGRAKKLKSRLDRITHGIPFRVDRHNGCWPAPPGEPQHEYEPARTIEGSVNRNARIKALGNAVVPQVVYPLAVTIKKFLEKAL